MSSIDIAFRSVEHILRLLLINKVYYEVAQDFDSLIIDLRALYVGNATLLSALGHLVDFRNKWAHNDKYNVGYVSAALEIVRTEISTNRNDCDLSFHIIVDTTKELLKVLSDVDLTRKIIRVGEVTPATKIKKGGKVSPEVYLNPNSTIFSPMDDLITKTYPEYGTMTLQVYKEDELLRNFIKGKLVLIMEGKYAGKIGTFRRFSGSSSMIDLGEDTAQSISNRKSVRICVKDTV